MTDTAVRERAELLSAAAHAASSTLISVSVLDTATAAMRALTFIAATPTHDSAADPLTADLLRALRQELTAQADPEFWAADFSVAYDGQPALALDMLADLLTQRRHQIAALDRVLDLLPTAH